MSSEVLILIGITIFVGIIVAFIIAFYEIKFTYEEKKVRFIEEPSEIQKILVEFEGDSRLETHFVNNLNKSHMRVSSVIRYKRKPKTTEWKKVSEMIIKVNYYIAN